ncbi:MAG: ATP-binding protein [Acidobacteriota bacterium]
MSLQRRFQVYIVVLHVWLAVAAALLWRISPWWTVAAELVLVASAAIGLRLISRLFESLRAFASASALIDDGELTTRMLPSGSSDLDRLVTAYNRMIDTLRAERVRLQEQQWFLAKIIAASPAGVVSFALDGAVTDLNPAAERLLGAPKISLLGKPISQLPGVYGAELATAAVGKSRLLTADGRRVRCQLSEFFERGFSRRFLLIEELTAELHRAEKSAYEKSIRVMAHEINNSVGASNALLAACRHYAPQLAASDRNDFEQALDLAIARGKHLNAFLNRFADVFRLPAPQATPCHLGELASAVMRLAQAGAPPGIDWSLQLDEPSPLASIDRYQLEQVLLNVLRNAREAVGERGRIVLRVQHRGEGARLEVEDDGPGFDADSVSPLSSPFHTTKPHGQGIGLTIAREILTAHGFRFGIDSRIGGPTCFWIQT